MSETSSVSTCSFTNRGLPPDTVVIAAVGDTGHEVGFRIDQSGHATVQLDIAVHADKPTALLLTAYEPTIWNIGWSKDTQIVAVFATGHHRQVVAGLPKGTPVIVTSHETNGPCGSQYVIGEAGLEWLNPRARSAFGLPVTRVYNRAADGLIDIVESTRLKGAYETSPVTPPESFRDNDIPLSGGAALNHAVAKGQLRVAMPQDWLGLQQHMAGAQVGTVLRRPGDVPPVAGASAGPPSALLMPTIPLDRTYIVIKAFTFPAGLYGANAVNFVVPKGVESPTGNPGHSIVYDLNKVPTDCASIRCR